MALYEDGEFIFLAVGMLILLLAVPLFVFNLVAIYISLPLLIFAVGLLTFAMIDALMDLLTN